MAPSLHIRIVECDSYLHVIHQGVIDDIDAALSCFRKSMQEAHRLEKTGILADLRAVIHQPMSAVDRIIYFQSASEVYNEALSQSEKTLRLAILQPPETESHYTPGVDTGRENGMEVQLFYAEQQALSWLGS